MITRLTCITTFTAATVAANTSILLYPSHKTLGRYKVGTVLASMVGLSYFSIFLIYTHLLLPNLLSSLKPSRVYWILWGYGTAATAAASTLAFNAFNGSVAPWGKTGIACQIIFSIAIGYFYTDLFNSWLTASLASKSIKDNLLPTIEKNQLIDFTSILRTTPPEQFEELLTKTPLLLLAGNEMVETLASHLQSFDGQYEINFNKPVSIPAEQEGEIAYFDQILKDHLQHLSQFLSIYELLKLSMTCKKMYHSICGAEGQNLWRNKKVGSLTSFRSMTLLARSLDAQTRSSNNPTFLLHATVLKQALFLAWPKDLIQHLGKHLSTSQDFKEGISLLWLNEDPHQTLPKLLKWVKKPQDMLLTARFLREHPDCFKGLLELFDDLHVKIDVQENLYEYFSRYGLPKNSLDAICHMINKYLFTVHENQNPLRNGSYTLKILQRIKIDHPEYSFENTLHTVVINSINTIPFGKPCTYYLNQHIKEDLSQ